MTDVFAIVFLILTSFSFFALDAGKSPVKVQLYAHLAKHLLLHLSFFLRAINLPFEIIGII